MTDLTGLVSMVDTRAGSRETAFGNINLRFKVDCENFITKYLPS